MKNASARCTRSCPKNRSRSSHLSHLRPPTHKKHSLDLASTIFAIIKLFYHTQLTHPIFEIMLSLTLNKSSAGIGSAPDKAPVDVAADKTNIASASPRSSLPVFPSLSSNNLSGLEKITDSATVISEGDEYSASRSTSSHLDLEESSFSHSDDDDIFHLSDQDSSSSLTSSSSDDDFYLEDIVNNDESVLFPSLEESQDLESFKPSFSTLPPLFSSGLFPFTSSDIQQAAEKLQASMKRTRETRKSLSRASKRIKTSKGNGDVEKQVKAVLQSVERSSSDVEAHLKDVLVLTTDL